MKVIDHFSHDGIGRKTRVKFVISDWSVSIRLLLVKTESIVSSVEAVETYPNAKDNIRSRIDSTVQSASIPDNNLTKDEQQALKRLKNDDNIVILPADRGRVTVVMDKTDYFDKKDALVNDKQTYEELKRDPTPALLRQQHFYVPKIRTNYGKFNIRYNGPKLWNETDERFKILTPHLFKKELTKHFIKFY